MLTYRICAKEYTQSNSSKAGSVYANVDNITEKALKNFQKILKKTKSTESRYANNATSVLYTAQDVSTAHAESAYWAIRRTFNVITHDISVEYILYEIKVSGKYKKYNLKECSPMFVHPNIYDVTNKISRNAIRKNLQYLIVPSARKLFGYCVPIFDNACCNFMPNAKVVKFEWKYKEKNIYINDKIVKIDDVYDYVLENQNLGIGGRIIRPFFNFIHSFSKR